MDFLFTVLAFVAAIMLLVSVHEFGHFFIARKCGVKVQRFSVGFGKPLYTWIDKHGCEFVISPIPLGGYVKMYGESPSDASTDEGNQETLPSDIRPDQLFYNKTVWQRFAIVAAGPVINLFFAILIFTVLYMSGSTEIKPIVEDIVPQSIAEQADVRMGDQIIAVDGDKVNSWQQVGLKLVKRIGESGEIKLELQRDGLSKSATLKVDAFMKGNEEVDPVQQLGILSFPRYFDATIGAISPESPADKAGLMLGDTIELVGDVEIIHYQQMRELIRSMPEVQTTLMISRPIYADQNDLNDLVITDYQSKVLDVTFAKVQDLDGSWIGQLGVSAESPLKGRFVQVRYGPIDALVLGVKQTGEYIYLTLDGMVKLIKGLLSIDNIRGVIGIAEVAGDAAKGGLETFLNLLAYLSIVLGVMNLLPIPLLDGGHLTYYLYEIIRGKPLSINIQNLANSFGMMVLFSLMMLALYNDINRLM